MKATIQKGLYKFTSNTVEGLVSIQFDPNPNVTFKACESAIVEVDSDTTFESSVDVEFEAYEEVECLN